MGLCLCLRSYGEFEQKLDPGAAVALGAPLHVRMFVPLWLVNATPLPIAALVVPVAPPSEARNSDAKAAAQGLMDVAESIRLKVLETDAGTRQSPRGYVSPLFSFLVVWPQAKGVIEFL